MEVLEAKAESSGITQSLLVRVVELEDENRKLKNEVAILHSSYQSAQSKNRLLQAKLLELQARLDFASKMRNGPVSRFRSPFVTGGNGSLSYRFERPPATSRPSTARSHVEDKNAMRSSAVGLATPRDRPLSGTPRTEPVTRKEKKNKALRPSGQQEGASSSHPLQQKRRRSRTMDGLKILEDDIRSGSFTRSSTITIEVAYFAQSSPVGKAVDVDQQELFAEHVEQIRGAVEIALKGWDVQVIVNDGKEAGSEGSSRKLDAGCFELWLKWQCPVLRSVLLYRRGNSSDAMPDIFTLFSEILQVGCELQAS
mmetsp:Transcript_41450/g.130525  ORF Transcript_41450/g.130525 Transcript_41450/m.130525 type:complete len:311 (+) Transcript_41450:118-1050(+)